MRIIDLCQKGADQGMLEKCAEIYCQIWREPPWNEDFWTVPKVMDDMVIELDKSFSNGFAAMNEVDEVVGFVWGYAVSKQELRSICGSEELDYLFVDEKDQLYYIDELGVSFCHRIKGIGTALSWRLINAAREDNFSWFVLRTDQLAIAARKLYSKMGFQELSIRDAKYSGRSYWAKEFSSSSSLA